MNNKQILKFSGIIFIGLLIGFLIFFLLRKNRENFSNKKDKNILPIFIDTGNKLTDTLLEIDRSVDSPKEYNLDIDEPIKLSEKSQNIIDEINKLLKFEGVL